MRRALHWTGVALATVFAGGAARAQSTERVSVSGTGVEGNNPSGSFYWAENSISSDGRFVFFASSASNLIANDTNPFWDVFVHDRQAGTIELVSLDSFGQQSLGDANVGSFSADTRFVCFTGTSGNLVPGDTNNCDDIFIRDRQLGLTERVSLGPNGVEGDSNSLSCSMSTDARCVVFMSWATNLVPGDTNGRKDIFVRDRLLGTTELISVASGGAQANFDCFLPVISSDGRFVAFETQSTTLVAGDTNLTWDCFVRDRQLGTTERISIDSGGAQANGSSRYPVLSADGRFVAFYSHATNLVAGDTNGHEDIFVRDRLLGTTELVSPGSGGAPANDGSRYPNLSADGRFVAFQSIASNLVPNDTNGLQDIFVHDRLLGTNERVSIDSFGAQSDYHSWFPRLSADGRCVVFTSGATNLVPGDTNGRQDVFVRDRGPLWTSAFCLGDGSAGDCPCANNGSPGRGCDNSSATGGAQLITSGSASLANDTLSLNVSGELDHSLSIFLQGTAAIAPVHFGDGLRCTGGVLHRLYVRNAAGGAIGVPQSGDPTISARSAALGDVLTAGDLRLYQTFYRDPVLSFCPNPPGNSWSISSGILVVWDP